jgi:hypothetical protein
MRPVPPPQPIARVSREHYINLIELLHSFCPLPWLNAWRRRGRYLPLRCRWCRGLQHCLACAQAPRQGKSCIEAEADPRIDALRPCIGSSWSLGSTGGWVDGRHALQEEGTGGSSSGSDGAAVGDLAPTRGKQQQNNWNQQQQQQQQKQQAPTSATVPPAVGMRGLGLAAGPLAPPEPASGRAPLPPGFDWRAYLLRYKDLRASGVRTREAAVYHCALWDSAQGGAGLGLVLGVVWRRAQSLLPYL